MKSCAVQRQVPGGPSYPLTGFIFNLMNTVTGINGHTGAISIIIDQNNDDTVKDGNDRLAQSPLEK